MMIDPEASNRARPHVAPLRIWIEYQEIQGKPGEVTEVHKIEYVKKGSNGASVVEKVSRIQKHDPALWEVLGPAYEAWKKGQEEPVDGTPLAHWPGVNPAQADRLRLMHVRTVEDVSAMTDADLDRLGMGARALRDKARAYIEAKKGSAIVAEAMAEKDREISGLRQNVADLTASVKELADKLGMTEKRGPGRPPKAA